MHVCVCTMLRHHYGCVRLRRSGHEQSERHFTRQETDINAKQFDSYTAVIISGLLDDDGCIAVEAFGIDFCFLASEVSCTPFTCVPSHCAPSVFTVCFNA